MGLSISQEIGLFLGYANHVYKTGYIKKGFQKLFYFTLHSYFALLLYFALLHSYSLLDFVPRLPTLMTGEIPCNMKLASLFNI